MTILALSNNPILNDGTRKGGFAPSQWVLGKFPRNPGNIHDEHEFADLGIISEKLSPDIAFKRLIDIRGACRGAFAAEDCSTRVQRALVRIAHVEERTITVVVHVDSDYVFKNWNENNRQPENHVEL